MFKLLAGVAASAVLALSLTISTTAVHAQEECNRGTLDKAYCDRDFNQTADLPLDE